MVPGEHTGHKGGVMFKKVFRYLFSSYLDEFRDELRFEFARKLVESQTEFDKDIAAIKTEAAEQILAIRRDMALEMNRAGIALMATSQRGLQVEL